MVRTLIMTIAFISIVVFNALANTLPFNGQSTGEISNRLPVLITPAGYTFSIWSVIYILFAIWIIGWWIRLKQGEVPSTKITLYFTLSAVMNIAWLFLWHYEYFGWSVAAIIAYLLALAGLYLQYRNSERKVMERMPVSVNLGWLIIATLVNINYVLTYYNWSGWGLSDQLWTVIILTFATAIALHIRFHHFDVPLALVFIWALIGIAVKNGTDELLVTTASLFLSGVIATGILLIKKRPA